MFQYRNDDYRQPQPWALTGCAGRSLAVCCMDWDYTDCHTIYVIGMIDAPDYIPTGSTVQGEEECTGEFYAIGNIVLREGAV